MNYGSIQGPLFCTFPSENRQQFSSLETFKVHLGHNRNNVATLASGSQPKQGLVKVQAKSETQKSHLMLPGI
jgi:hypothetical protein